MGIPPPDRYGRFVRLCRTIHPISAAPLALGLAVACSGSEPPPAPAEAVVEPPHIVALSSYRGSVGTLIEAYGSGFPEGSEGSVRLLFRGTFATQSGQRYPVELETPARRVDRSTVRWTSFGPYQNPFAPSSSEVGTFSGTLTARLVSADGTTLDDASPVDVSFEVLPSIVVRELQPLTASCNGPAKRALGGAAYRLNVEALGFEPESFTYTISAPAVSMEAVSVRHLATGRFDGVGERGDFVLPAVPEGVQSYNALVSVEARDAAGATRQTAFAIAVHRPLEIFYNGNLEIAEVLAPVPVSGCIPGGEAGRDVAYGESMQETRSRSYNVSWNESWLTSHTVSQGTNQTIGLEETNGIGFSTTDGRSWNWSLGAEVGGEFGFSELVSVGVKVNGSVGGGTSTSVEQSGNRSTGINQETTTTETEEASRQQGGEQGEAFAWEVSSTQSVSRDFGGKVIARTYGVFYRQAIRMLRRAAVVTYNQCGAATVVGDVDFSDWAWSPDLALGNACPPLPASNLPAAACIIPPCAGE